MTTDDNFSARLRPKSTILTMLDAEPKAATPPEGTAPGLGELTPLPRAGDPYVAHSRASNGAEATLFVIDAEGYYQGFAWSTYDRLRRVKPEKPGGEPVLVIRFHGSELTEITVEGRNLDALAVLLGQRRLVWIREQAAGHAFDVGRDEPVITRLTILPVES